MYAESWRIAQASSLFDYAHGEDTETFTDRSFPHELVTSASLSAPAFTSAPIAVSGNGSYGSGNYTPTLAGAYRWTATYTVPGAPDFVLRGRSTARYRGDAIVELVDEYPDGMDAEAAAWAVAHAPGMNASYV